MTTPERIDRNDKRDFRFYLLVDDVRSYMNMTAIARSYRAAIPILRDKPVTHLILDNDLGGKKDGYDLLMWARDNGKVPVHVHLVTANPVAKGKMEALLLNDLNYTCGTTGWWLSPDWKIGDP